MKKIFCVTALLLLCAAAFTADQQIIFNHNLLNAEGRSVKQMSDGSIFCLGYAEDSLGKLKTILTKLDASGNVLWWKSYGDSSIHQSLYLAVTDKNQLVITGEKVRPGNTDFEIMLLDTSGTVIWQYSYGTAKNESLKYIEPTSDHGFIGCGFITQANLASNDFLVVKFDSIGGIQWQKAYGTPNNDYAQMLKQTGGGNYVISGDTYNGRDYDNYLLLIDPSGNEIWHRQTGDANNNGNQSLLINHRGDFILCGESTTTGNIEFDIYLASFDSTGNFLWSRYLGGNGSDAGFAIIENQAHEYFITGYSTSPYAGAPYTAYLLKLDSLFHSEGIKYFLQPNLTICYDEIFLNDSTCALSGTSGSRFYLVLANDSGYLSGFPEHDFVSGFREISTVPIKAKVFLTGGDQLSVQVEQGENFTDNHFSLYSSTGDMILSNDFIRSLTVDLSSYGNIFFLWQIRDNRDRGISGKFVRF